MDSKDAHTPPQSEYGSHDRRFIQIGRAALPLRRGHIISDTCKIIACVATALCIFQFYWIQMIQKGHVRIPNDPFDIRFGQDVSWTSQSLWDDERLSFIHNAAPVPVHSHNDYSRRIPLFEALGSGCISVEADVHLVGSDLLVGHGSKDLHDSLNLRSMYLEPLERLLSLQNAASPADGGLTGLFDREAQQTVVLLVDIKTSGAAAFDELYTQLQPLRDMEYLSHWDGTHRIVRPLTIVATGNAPFESVLGLNSTNRDIFWDAKLEQLPSILDDFSTDPPTYKYNVSNTHYASTPFRNAKLHTWHNPSLPLPSTAQQKDIAATQIEQAEARGLISRYWDTPDSPPNLGDIVWRVLVDAKVGIINMDDMGAVRQRAHGWGKN
ncbi:Altered inheritance of mitochondria protein 6 [Elasticomyces elasticus]|nr:Altered inheritance of mitochondria protein 6 [Elasticomyces elasticus]KAK3655921.1 Altered inheritance of mitochondria protein 6 [Elasticomyces elasticus]KAK4921419.1 Altered inheritance of mitochondria protein 6 [Elasticomyces elasticus]KAK5760107.1 Altered inheritance of mitochondria protein 6 [Elasticomyces elasticus]